MAAKKETVKKTVEEVKEEDVKKEVKKEATKKETESKENRGMIVNCLRLNIRSEADKEAEVVATVPVGTILTYKTSGNKNWYSVITEEGIAGYCMKDYVKKVVG